jgi:KaiC/GvpD/RAD55 family RecA-like ATPase
MSIPIEVPGLDTIIPELGEGQLILVESGSDLAKSFFVRRVALTALRNNWPVTFVISRDRNELQTLLGNEGGPMDYDGRLAIFERDAIDGFEEFVQPGGLLAVDSFSFLTQNLPAPQLSQMLRNLRLICQGQKLSVLLATDRGMFDPRAEAVAAHMSDGFLQFDAREGTDGLIRYLRIPKWTGGKFVDRNIYYEFDGKRLAIDLRSRVL